MRDGEDVHYRDFATDVHTVKSCGIEAYWTKPIEFDKFGWHNNGGKLSFNPVGFNPNDEFATCHFESNPPMVLQWDKDVGEEAEGVISARMPASNAYMVGGIITCSIKDEVHYSDDQCTQGFVNKKAITMPPTRLQYAEVTDVTTKGRIWNYVNSEVDDQVVEFSCPLIDAAEMVKVVSFDEKTGKLWESAMKNQVSQELPDAPEAVPFAADPDLMTFIIRQNKYFVNIDMKNQPLGIREFRCQYLETQNGPILGYSSPHIIVKYEDDEDEFDATVVPQWGAGIDENNPFVKESKNEINIATCYQTTLGKPAQLFLRFKTDSGKWQHTEPSAQHFVAFNAPVSRKYDEATISCGYRYFEDDDEDDEDDVEEGEVTLGVIKVMFQPRGIKLNRNGDVLKCSGDISSMDTANARLSINQNIEVQMANGVAEFNRNQFTDEEFEAGLNNGMTCIVTSDSFDGQFQSSRYCPNCSNNHIEDDSGDLDPSFEVHLGGPIVLCLFGAAAVIAICFMMPKNTPPAEKGSYKVVETDDMGEDIVRIDESPLDDSNHSSKNSSTKDMR